MTQQRPFDIKVVQKAQPTALAEQDYADSIIKNIEYILLPNGRSTLCQITLNNGYTVEGISATVSCSSYDIDVGREIAYRKAHGKAKSIAAVLHKERIYQQRLADERLKNEIAAGVGQYFKHYSGAIYKLLSVVHNEADIREEMAVYQCTSDGMTFVRPYVDFLEKFTCINQLSGLDQLLMQLQAEYDEVAFRYTNLDRFVSVGQPENMTDTDWRLLKEQLSIMYGYHQSLMARMQNLAKKKGECHA